LSTGAYIYGKSPEAFSTFSEKGLVNILPLHNYHYCHSSCAFFWV
jgi:hypothetical protein